MALGGRSRNGFGFSKTLRLRCRREFLAVQRRGRRFRGRLMTVIARRSSVDRDGPTRLGITTSRKVGNAVARNRVKRLLRESFRLNQDRIPPGLDIVVIASPRAVTATFEQVQGELLTGVRKLSGQILRGRRR